MKYFLFLFLFSLSFAESYIQHTTYVDFNATLHNDFEDNKGFAVGFGFGHEILYIVNSKFAFGLNGLTNLNYDCYINSVDYYEGLYDDFGTWTGTLGGIVYVGDYFYLGYNLIYNFMTFHHDTWIDDGYDEIKMDDSEYDIDLSYSLTIGLRVRYYLSIYAEIRTLQIENQTYTPSKQVYLGLRYYI